MVLPGGDRAIVLVADGGAQGTSSSVVDILRYVNPATPCQNWSLFSCKPKKEVLILAPNLTRKELPKKKMDSLRDVPHEVEDLMRDAGVIHADWDEAGGKIALILHAPSSPPDIVVLDLSAFGEVDTGVPAFGSDGLYEVRSRTV